MPTTTDLRAALRDLADAAPETAPLPGDHDELLPVQRSRRTSRAVRFGAPALAGAMVAGVVVGAVALSSGSHRSAQPGTSPAPTSTSHLPQAGPMPLTETVFDVVGLPGATVGGTYADGVSQQRYLSFDAFQTDSNQADVQVWARGHWTPPRPAGAQDVTVNGKPGFYGRITVPKNGRVVALAWQYEPGAWAVVTWKPSSTKADLIRIASAVRTGLHTPARLPFQLSSLPSGGTIAALTYYPGAGRQGATGGLTVRYPGRNGLLLISVSPVAWDLGGTPTTIGGRRAWESGAVLAMAGPGVSEAILEPTTPDFSGDSNTVLTKAELRSIAAGLTFAPNVKDPATWFDASTALP
jgi:hypothetical protein